MDLCSSWINRNYQRNRNNRRIGIIGIIVEIGIIRESKKSENQNYQRIGIIGEIRIIGKIGQIRESELSENRNDQRIGGHGFGH